MIDEELLRQNGARTVKFPKDSMIFREGDFPVYYYQILSGDVKMNNYDEHGKEFIQNIFKPGQSFGEPPLFVEAPYPANAMTLTDVELMILKKESFVEWLSREPAVSLAIIQSLSRRLLYKAVMAPEISSQDAGSRLITLLNYQKENQTLHQEQYSFRIPLTRQQMADLTGLRVETVIRAIKQLEKKGVVKLQGRKIFY